MCFPFLISFDEVSFSCITLNFPDLTAQRGFYWCLLKECQGDYSLELPRKWDGLLFAALRVGGVSVAGGVRGGTSMDGCMFIGGYHIRGRVAYLWGGVLMGVPHLWVVACSVGGGATSGGGWRICGWWHVHWGCHIRGGWHIYGVVLVHWWGMAHLGRTEWSLCWGWTAVCSKKIVCISALFVKRQLAEVCLDVKIGIHCIWING